MSNTFFQGGKNFARGASPPLLVTIMVVIVTGCALIVTSHYDVKFSFPIQRFGEVGRHNAYHYIHALSLFLVILPADNFPILAGIQPAELRRNGATLSPARHAMEPGHLLHSALTRPSNADARRLKSRHPFVPAAQQLIISSDNKNTRAARPSQEEPGSGSIASAPVSNVSAPACTNGVWLLLRPVSVAQKNKPSTMLSSNVQSIDFPLSAWPDGPGRWENRMAAQHLPRDLVRPSSRLNN